LKTAVVTALAAAGERSTDRQLRADLAAEFFRWEVAVAAACSVLDIHPFNQPDVQLAKDLATRAMDAGGAVAGAPSVEHPEASSQDLDALARALDTWMAGVRQGDYVAVQAYLAPTTETASALQQIRDGIGGRRCVATTLGYGPRFLHSTGQLHKGGPGSGVFLQLVDDPDAAGDLPVPETRYTFGALIHAQARGDFLALHQRGRRVLRVDLGADTRIGLQRLVQALG